MTGHIFVYGEIGTGPGEVSLKSIKASLNPDASDYILHIVSGGGSVFEGYGIYNILKNTGKPIITHIEGICASISTLIAFAGEKIIMNRTSEFMIHNPNISDLSGDSRTLRNAAAQLDKIKSLLIDVSQRRAARNGKSISTEKLNALYDNETWLTATEAVEYGFADEVQDAIKAVAKLDLKKFQEMEKDTIWDRMKNLFSLKKFRNEFTETLADGRIIIVMSDDEDWTGKQVVLEDGSALAAGDHQLASGKTITVDEAGVITQVSEAPAPEDKNNEEMDNKIKELEAKLAEKDAQLEKAQAEAQAAKTITAKFENKLTELEKAFIDLKEKSMVPIGDTTPPGKGPVFKNAVGDRYDPFGEDMLKFAKGQGLIM